MTIITTMKEYFLSFNEDNRRLVIGLILSLLILVLTFGLLQRHLSLLDKRKIAREQTLTELLSLRQQYQEAAVDANRVKNRLALVTPEDSPATILEHIGIIAKTGIQSKPLARQEKNGLLEEGAEITLSGLSLNELVNLLFRIEQGAKPLVIKKLLTRTHFNEPSKLDVTLTLTLYRAAQQLQERR